MKLENWLRNKLQENEEMHDYAVATDTVRCWIYEYKQLSTPNVVEQSEQLVCDECNGFIYERWICAICEKEH